MGIESFIAQACDQTAVYWGAPVDDGYGGKTFGSMYPVEIDCRWEDRVEKLSLVGARMGEEIISSAVVFVTEDLDEMGYLFLGDLDDLSSEEEEDPKDVDGAYEIKRFDKTPVLRRTTKFIRKAYL